MTMLTFNTNNPRKCGIVEVDEDGIVIGFYEKQDSPPGNRANAAVYVFDDDLIEFIEQRNLTINDNSTQLIPLLKGKIQTFHTNEEYIDIGTHKDLERARTYFRSNT